MHRNWQLELSLLIKLENRMDIRVTSPISEDIQELFQLLDAHNLSHCPPEICNLTQPEELSKADSILLGVLYDKKLVGMGGLKFYRDYAEVTKMFLKEAYRGKGFASGLLMELENIARERAKHFLKLETSDRFENAVRLYEKLGFSRCEPFGEYVDKPYNSYFEKKII